MAIGPVQLLVLGFEHPDFQDEALELGSKVAALIGLGIEGEEGMANGAKIGAEAVPGGAT